MNSTKLKDRINKTEFLKEARIECERMYKNAYEPEICVNVFMHGLKYTMRKLQQREK